MSIAAVIVNYNAGDTLQLCVEALLNSSQCIAITVVDNASTDGSAQLIQDIYADEGSVKVCFNAENIGFAPAVNAVARKAESDWFLILNPDCILQTAALDRLQSALENDAEAALAGPAVLDEHGRIQRATARRFPNPWRSLMTASGLWRLGRWLPSFRGIEIDVDTLGNGVAACEAVSGACMLIRRKVFAQAAYLDEAYGMHCEDIDLMYRFAEMGWHCLYVPQAEAVHRQGLSSRSRPSWVHFQKHRGMLRFFNKFQADASSLPVRMLVRTGIWLRFLILWPGVLLRR